VLRRSVYCNAAKKKDPIASHQFGIFTHIFRADKVGIKVLLGFVPWFPMDSGEVVDAIVRCAPNLGLYVFSNVTFEKLACGRNG
jgi:hypothetical protein